MIDWSKVRFMTCRLCDRLLDEPGPKNSQFASIGLRPGMPQRHCLCGWCLWRGATWIRRRAGECYLAPDLEYDPADGETREEFEAWLSEERARAAEMTKVSDNGGPFSDRFASYAAHPEYWRDERTALTDLDVTEFVASVLARRPAWARLAILCVAA